MEQRCADGRGKYNLDSRVRRLRQMSGSRENGLATGHGTEERAVLLPVVAGLVRG